MKRTLILSLALGLFAPVTLVALSGCGEETKTEVKEKVETPGGSTTKTETTKIEKTGDHKDNP